MHGKKRTAVTAKKMSYLIIPDVHNHYEDVENLIRMFPERRVVFLGDYFDNYNDTPTDARATAEWLAYSIRKGRTHLMGNHDLPYRWAMLNCPGWTKSKHKEVMRVMTAELWCQVGVTFLLSWKSDEDMTNYLARPLLLSHAGVSLPNLYHADEREFYKHGRLRHLCHRTVDEYLDEMYRQQTQCLSAAMCCGDHQSHHWLQQGSRMGARDIAGPFWQDDEEFLLPPRGIDQIVGHSKMIEPELRPWPHKHEPQAETWFIDCAGRAAALVDFEHNGRGGMKVTPIHAKGVKAGQPFNDDDL